MQTMRRNLVLRLLMSAVAVDHFLQFFDDVDAFNLIAYHTTSTVQSRLKFMDLRSSIGDGGDGPPSKSGGDNRRGWEDFLNRNENESENLIRAREYISDNSLPISYDQTGETNNIYESRNISQSALNTEYSNSSALATNNMQANPFSNGLSSDTLLRNPYLAVVTKLSPSDIISRFTSTAPPSVQNAVRSTILGLIGGLPKMAFETTTVTTGQKLASLMFQLQMTGYMFKNAEYRLSLRQSLDDQFLKGPTIGGKIKGKLRVRYGITGEIESDSSAAGLEMEVDAASYMSELRSEVSKLRDELMIARKEQEDVIRRDLLMYIRTLPPQELQSLTNTMSQDVLIAMKGLVNAVIAGIGEGQIGPDTITEQSSEAMAQLCMWQLALGYNLRTLEVREEMLKAISGGKDITSGVDLHPDSNALE